MNFLMKSLLTIAFGFCTVTSLQGLENEDQEAIHSIIASWENAWNAHAGKGLADCYAADADFVNPLGQLFSGSAEIENRHILILNSFLKQSEFNVQEVRLREVNTDLVISHIFWELKNGHLLPPEKRPAHNLKGIFTHVFIREGHEWKITASQNTVTTN